SCAVSSGPQENVYVERVVDGDTVRLDNGDLVRLIGINAPELRHGQHVAEAYARQATDALAGLVEDRKVRLEPGVERLDRYKRRLAYLFLPDGADVQKKLLEQGLAFVIAVPPDIRRADEYLAAENTARDAGRGLWARADHLFKDPKSLSARDKGRFRLVKGEITRVIRAKKNIYLKLGDSFGVRIPQSLWREHWRGNPDRLRGKTIEVRGWIGKNRYGYTLPVRHPVMMQIL
ncbi:MAG: hypothetical protein DSZ32_01930, partial [Gammaproteobacteria bacterium]